MGLMGANRWAKSGDESDTSTPPSSTYTPSSSAKKNNSNRNKRNARGRSDNNVDTTKPARGRHENASHRKPRTPENILPLPYTPKYPPEWQHTEAKDDGQSLKLGNGIDHGYGKSTRLNGGGLKMPIPVPVGGPVGTKKKGGEPLQLDNSIDQGRGKDFTEYVTLKDTGSSPHGPNHPPASQTVQAREDRYSSKLENGIIHSYGKETGSDVVAAAAARALNRKREDISPGDGRGHGKSVRFVSSQVEAQSPIRGSVGVKEETKTCGGNVDRTDEDTNPYQMRLDTSKFRPEHVKYITTLVDNVNAGLRACAEDHCLNVKEWMEEKAVLESKLSAEEKEAIAVSGDHGHSKSTVDGDGPIIAQTEPLAEGLSSSVPKDPRAADKPTPKLFSETFRCNICYCLFNNDGSFRAKHTEACEIWEERMAVRKPGERSVPPPDWEHAVEEMPLINRFLLPTRMTPAVPPLVQEHDVLSGIKEYGDIHPPSNAPGKVEAPPSLHIGGMDPVLIARVTKVLVEFELPSSEGVGMQDPALLAEAVELEAALVEGTPVRERYASYEEYAAACDAQLRRACADVALLERCEKHIEKVNALKRRNDGADTAATNHIESHITLGMGVATLDVPSSVVGAASAGTPPPIQTHLMECERRILESIKDRADKARWSSSDKPAPLVGVDGSEPLYLDSMLAAIWRAEQIDALYVADVKELVAMIVSLSGSPSPGPHMSDAEFATASKAYYKAVYEHPVLVAKIERLAAMAKNIMRRNGAHASIKSSASANSSNSLVGLPRSASEPVHEESATPSLSGSHVEATASLKFATATSSLSSTTIFRIPPQHNFSDADYVFLIRKLAGRQISAKEWNLAVEHMSTATFGEPVTGTAHTADDATEVPEAKVNETFVT